MRLGQQDVTIPMVMYFNYFSIHTIDDIRLYHPEWYDSCDIIWVTWHSLESEEQTEQKTGISLQSRTETQTNRQFLMGEITLEPED